MGQDRIIILVALLIVIIAGTLNRRIGGILGIIFTGGLTYWGLNILKSGGHLFILKYNLSKEIFLLIMGVFIVYNFIIALAGFRKKE